MRLIRLVMPTLLIVFAGCSSILGDDTDSGFSRQIGFISYEGVSGTIVFAPQYQPTSVTITTVGDGCTSKADTKVSQSGETLRVTPYDFHGPDNALCPAIIEEIKHVVEIPAGVRFVVVTVRESGKEAPLEAKFGW